MRVMTPSHSLLKKGMLPVLEVERTKTAVRHLCEITSTTHPYPIVVAEMPPVEFDKWYVHDPKTPVTKVAEIYRERALRLGASSEALDIIGKHTTLSEGDRNMATSKAAAKAPAATTKEAGAAGPAKVKGGGSKRTFVSADEAVKTATKPPKPAKTEKAAEDRPEKASDMFRRLIMEKDGRTGLCKHTDDEIFAAVQQAFGLDDNKRSYVAWYRNDLRKREQNPPDPKGASPAEKPAKGSDEAKAKMASVRGKKGGGASATA